jgi:hypothetical protein
MATSWLPLLEVRDTGPGFTLSGPRDALAQLADGIVVEDLKSMEVTPDDGSVITIRVESDGHPVEIKHSGQQVSIVGGRDTLSYLADSLRFLAASRRTRDHLHIEHFAGHLWLSEYSEPIVVEVLRVGHLP